MNEVGVSWRCRGVSLNCPRDRRARIAKAAPIMRPSGTGKMRLPSGADEADIRHRIERLYHDFAKQ